MAAATRMVRDLGKVIAVSLTAVSCLKTEVINAIEPEEHEAVVEKKRKPLPEHQQPDTTHTDERVPIGWNPSVEDWNETNVEL